MLERFQTFINEDIWQIERKDLSKSKSFGIWILRILVLTIKGFQKRQIQQGASALTYYTLLSLVPVIAFLFGIARGFFLEDELKKLLLTKFSVQEQVVAQLIVFAEASLNLLRRGVIAGVGALILLWSVINILRNIEAVFNEVWEVNHRRSLAKQFSDYLALIFICPLILIASSSVTIYLSTKVATLGNEVHLIAKFNPIFYYFLNILSFALNCALFTFIYIFVPNTTVKLKPALYAGVITSVCYQIIQAIYLNFQIGVSSYNAIYGTFAAFPLFLIWLHISWSLLLLGSKIAFALQNVDAYEFVTDEFDMSNRIKRILSLRIVHDVVKRFEGEKASPSKAELSRDLHIPLVLTSHILIELLQGKILMEVTRDQDSETGFIPAIPIENLTIKKVLDMIDTRGDEIPLPPSEELEVILKSLEQFSHLADRSKSNLPLKDF